MYFWGLAIIMDENKNRTSSGPRGGNGRTLMPHNQPGREPGQAYKKISVVIFLVVIVYLLGQLVGLFRQETPEVESVRMGTLDLPVSFEGLIIRDEQVYTSSTAGAVTYYYTEGDRLKKNSLVCQVRADGTAEKIEAQLAALDESLLAQQRERADISPYKNDIAAVEKKIGDLVYSYNSKMNNFSLSGLAGFRSQLEQQLAKRTQLWMLGGQDTGGELNAQREGFEAQLSSSAVSVTNTDTGVLSLYYDGREETLTPENRTEVTPEQMGARNPVERILTSAATVEEGGVLFTLVRSNTWYVVGYLDNEDVAGWEAGDSMTLSAQVEEAEVEVAVVVDSLTLGDTTAQVVFRTDRQMQDFLGQRSLTFSVKGSLYEGLKIPNTALVEKTLLKIPRDCLRESLDGYHVIRRSGSGDELLAVNILRSDEESIYLLQDYEGGLKLGDTILQGTGEAATAYTVADATSYQGVYVVNSSVAAFTVVEVLAQNADYAIVRPSTRSSGLQVYDNIVSDASSVQEGEQIY